MSIERLKNTLFESLPPDDDCDTDNNNSTVSTTGSPPLSPKLGNNPRKLVTYLSDFISNLVFIQFF